MSGSKGWNSYEWTLPQMNQEPTIPILNADGQNSFLLNSEFNWASHSGHAYGTGVDEDMHSQNPLMDFLPDHGLTFSPNASLSVSGPGVDTGVGSPYFAYDTSSSDGIFGTPHNTFSSFSTGRPIPEMAALSPSSLVDGGTDFTEDEPATPSDKPMPEPLSTSSPIDSSSLVPNLIDLMKAAQNETSDRPTLFKSHEHARSFYRTSEPLPEDPTLPQTYSQKRAIVKEMCKAMLSLEHATDNEGMIRPFRNGKYFEERIEVCCWQTLETVIMRQKSGPLLAAYEPTAKADNETPNFAQRMTRIIECFYKHKTVCKHILDPPYLYSLVDNPAAAEKRVESNKLLNRRKGHIMTAGKEVLRIEHRRPATTTTTTTSPKKPRVCKTVAMKAPRTAASKTVARKMPKITAEDKGKARNVARKAYSETSESSDEGDRIFTPSSTPEPTGSEADASPASLVASVARSSPMLVPQAMSYYPQQQTMNGEPAYHLNPSMTYPAHNKGYQQAYMSNLRPHRMTAPGQYSLTPPDFMSSHAASYYPSMAHLHVKSSPISEGQGARHNAVVTPVRSAKATRKRASITITDDLGQPSSAEKRKR